MSVASYDIFPLLSHAIVPFSTIALETAYYGIRTIVASDTGAAPLFDAALPAFTVDALHRILEPFLANTNPYGLEDYRRIYRFIHAGFVKSSFVFKSIGIRDVHLPTDPPITDDDLVPGADADLDQVCDRILFGAPLYRRPTRSSLEDFDNETSALAPRVRPRMAERGGLPPVEAAHP